MAGIDDHLFINIEDPVYASMLQQLNHLEMFPIVKKEIQWFMINCSLFCDEIRKEN